jgi:hypothetical protein
MERDDKIFMECFIGDDTCLHYFQWPGILKKGRELH